MAYLDFNKTSWKICSFVLLHGHLSCVNCEWNVKISIQTTNPSIFLHSNLQYLNENPVEILFERGSPDFLNVNKTYKVAK